MELEINYQNIISETLKSFPDYIDTDHYKYNDQNLQYSFFYGFTNYVIDLINNGEDDEKVKKAFELFNFMISSEDEELSTLGVVEVLETLVQQKKSKDLAFELLNEKSRGFIIEVLKYTGVKD